MSTAIRHTHVRSEKARITRPKPGATRPRRRVRERRPGQYNPRIASRGLTLDTGLGPVDLVAVERAMAGRGPITLTAAEREVLIDKLAAQPPAMPRPNVLSPISIAAAAIGAHPDWLGKRVYARRAVLRVAGRYPADPQAAGHG